MDESSKPPVSNTVGPIRFAQVLTADDRDFVWNVIRKALANEPSLRLCGKAADGPEVAYEAKGLSPDVIVLDLAVIMLRCSNDVGTVVKAIRTGADDYLTKPFDKSEWDAAMLKSRQKNQLWHENQALRDYCDQVAEDLSFLAASPQMVRIRRQILQIAPVDVPVFICGETGVGKEVVARMIHLRSKRSNQPFVKVNCAALPEELLESELFGFEQGAFTGAVRAKPGKFELANKGTIFLDEIAEMSTHLQAKLLHVLQDHQYSRLGGRHMIDADVRVLAATNVDVQGAMKMGRFREDLYYRLNVFSIMVPPLRERRTEIELLFRHFIQKYSKKFGKAAPGPSKHLLDAAVNYPWPGNLRELENFVTRYVILEDDEGSLRELIEMSAARQRTSLRQEPMIPKDQGLKALVRRLKDEAEKEAIADTLEKVHGRRQDAAKMLRISYKALGYKMKQFDLDTGRPRRSPSTAEEAEAGDTSPLSGTEIHYARRVETRRPGTPTPM